MLVSKAFHNSMSTLYTSSMWSVHTYIQPILNAMSYINKVIIFL